MSEWKDARIKSACEAFVASAKKHGMVYVSPDWEGFPDSVLIDGDFDFQKAMGDAIEAYRLADEKE